MMVKWSNSSPNTVYHKHFMPQLQPLKFPPIFGIKLKISRRKVAMEMCRGWSRDFPQLEITICKWFNRYKRS